MTDLPRSPRERAQAALTTYAEEIGLTWSDLASIFEQRVADAIADAEEQTEREVQADVFSRLQQLERELASAKQGCTMETVVAPDGSPVAAPCAISGCEYGTFETRLREVEEASTGVFVALKSRAEIAESRLQQLDTEKELLACTARGWEARHDQERLERIEAEAQLQQLEQEKATLQAKLAVAEHHKVLSLLGKSSWQEVVEEKLRVELAETQITLAETRDALHRLVTEWKHEALHAHPMAASEPYRQGLLKCATHLETFLAAKLAPVKEQEP